MKEHGTDVRDLPNEELMKLLGIKPEDCITEDEEEVGGLFASFFINVRSPERDGYHQTSYFFDDDAELTVLNFNTESDDEHPHNPELDTMNHQIIISKRTLFRIETLGILREGKWGTFIDQKQEGENEFRQWLKEDHQVTSVAGTD